MSRNFLTTVSGRDIPGVIKSLAQTTRRAGGSWLACKLIKLDGQFAAIMSVVVDKNKEVQLKSTLEKKFPDLQFVYAHTNSIGNEATKTIQLMVDCIDRPGLTGDLSNILTNLDIGVEAMECKRFTMEGINDKVFSAKLTLAVPETAESEVIAGEIEALAEEIRVNVL